MSIYFINITKEDFLRKKLLYKYLPLEFALGTIKDRYLWLCNPTIWKDPFEKRFINAKYLVNKNVFEFPLKSQIFCTCFTQTPTSEAHWNNYTNHQIGISLKINRQRLLDVLEEHTDTYDIYIGNVTYLKTAVIRKKLSEIDDIKNINPFNLNNRELILKLLLFKRIAFRYEDEMRVLAVKKFKTKENGIKLSFNMKPSELIDSIIIDPSIGSNNEEMLKELFKSEYGFTHVFKSQLYSMSNDILIEL